MGDGWALLFAHGACNDGADESAKERRQPVWIG